MKANTKGYAGHRAIKDAKQVHAHAESYVMVVTKADLMCATCWRNAPAGQRGTHALQGCLETQRIKTWEVHEPTALNMENPLSHTWPAAVK